MAYMYIPREYLSRCGAELNSIPRCLKDLLYDERALDIVESDLFLEAIIDVYAYLVCPHMGYKESQMEIFSRDAPEWRYAHAAPMWIDGLEKVSNHHFKWWFANSPIRAEYMGRLKAVLQAILAYAA